MPLETASYVKALVTSNPVHTDGLNQSDAHLRLIKTTLVNTFPNLDAAVTATPAQLNTLASGATPLPVGAVQGFLLGTTDPNWKRLNGGTFNFTDFPVLGAYLGFTSGVCTLPNWEDTGRFPRSVTTGLAAGATQANTVGPHAHPATSSVTVSGNTGAESASHFHAFSGNTGDQSNDHSHTLPSWSNSIGQIAGGSGVQCLNTQSSAFTSSGSSTGHVHSFSGNTSAESAPHVHAFSGTFAPSVTVANNTGTTETRPESAAIIWYIHI